jgi:chromatin remodeling complex protein RSC6
MTKTSDKTTTKTTATPATPAKKRVTKKTTTAATTAATTATTTAATTAAATATTVTPVVTTTSTKNNVETTATETTTDNTLFEQFTVFMGKLQSVGAQFSSLKTDFRALEKRCTRDFKVAQKASTKGKRRSGNREPSGFVKPTIISTELAKFLKKPEGTLMARTEVTKEINSYIRANSLQDKTNGRHIIPDAALTKLLKINKNDELTYFNLQKFMSHHFPKKVVDEKTA